MSEQETTGKQSQSNLTEYVQTKTNQVLRDGLFNNPNPPAVIKLGGEEGYGYPNWIVKAHEAKCKREVERLEALKNMKYLWEILVPTEWHQADEKGVVDWTSPMKPIRTRHHRAWDAKVIEITGGLTIIGKVGGKWVSKDGIKYEEDMLTVRILCTTSQIRQIAEFTASHYRQKAVMYSKMSSESHIYEVEEDYGLDEAQVVS